VYDRLNFATDEWNAMERLVFSERELMFTFAIH